MNTQVKFKSIPAKHSSTSNTWYQGKNSGMRNCSRALAHAACQVGKGNNVTPPVFRVCNQNETTPENTDEA